MAAPTPSAAREPRKTFPPFIIEAPTTAARANTDPTDRSIPPESITKVIPNAIMALIEICLKTFKKFDKVKNLLVRMLNNTTTPIKPRIMGNFLKRFKNFLSKIINLP